MGDNKHHWVPQFYLHRWADNGQLSRLNLEGGARFKQAVRNAASSLGFYAVPRHPDDPEFFEKLFSKLEGQASAVFDAVLERGVWPLSADDRETLAFFVTVQALRGPEQRQLMKDLQTKRVARVSASVAEMGAAAWIEDRFGLRLDDAQAGRVWSKATDHDEPPVVIDAEYHIEQIARLADLALPSVLARRWTLIRFQEPSLFTSDVPVSLDDPGRASGKSGLVSARTLVYPMNRETALVLDDSTPARANAERRAVQAGRFDRRKTGGAAERRFVNERTADIAREALFSHPEDVERIPELPRQGGASWRPE